MDTGDENTIIHNKNLGACCHAPVLLEIIIHDMERAITQDKNLCVCGHAPVLLYTFIYDMEKIITQDKNLGACCQHRSSSTLRTKSSVELCPMSLPEKHGNDRVRFDCALAHVPSALARRTVTVPFQ